MKDLGTVKLVDGILTNIIAQGYGYGVPFKGAVEQLSDLEDLVTTAAGIGELDLHRGHSPIESVLELFLGISHKQMHVYMENDGLNLAGCCKVLNLSPDHLIQSLTNSFEPYIDQGVSLGVITAKDKLVWISRVKAQFHKRVFWNG